MFAALEAVASLVATLVLGQWVVRGLRARQSIPTILAALAFYLYAQVRATAEILKGLRGEAPVWVRTLKTGAVGLDMAGAAAPAAVGGSDKPSTEHD